MRDSGGMRPWVLALLVVAGCSVQERKASPPVEDRDTAAVIARVKAVPGMSGRLRPDSALVPATLGVKLDGKTELDVIVPLTARGPLRIMRDDGRVLDVNADHTRDVKGLIESGAMVFVAPTADHDSVMIAEPARFTDLHVLRGPTATTIRLQLRLGDALANARIEANQVQLVQKNGTVWLRSDPLESVDASGAHRPLLPKLEGSVLLVSIDPNGAKFPVVVPIVWSESR